MMDLAADEVQIDGEPVVSLHIFFMHPLCGFQFLCLHPLEWSSYTGNVYHPRVSNFTIDIPEFENETNFFFSHDNDKISKA